jgi:hypothetical protein
LTLLCCYCMVMSHELHCPWSIMVHHQPTSTTMHPVAVAGRRDADADEPTPSGHEGK